MLIKLIKHELIATYRNYLTIYIGAVLLSIMLGFMFLLENSTTNLFTAILLFLWLILLISAGVIFIIQSIRMFNRDLFSPQGYLTLTLPAPIWQILLSKIIVLFIWMAVTSVVFVFSCCLTYLLAAIKYREFLELTKIYQALQETFTAWGLPLYYYLSLLIEFIVKVFYCLVLIGFSLSVVSTGWLRKGKMAIAVVIYFLLNHICYLLSSFLSRLLQIGDEAGIVWERLTQYRDIANLTEKLLTISLFNISFYLMLGVGLFTAVCWIIDTCIEIE